MKFCRKCSTEKPIADFYKGQSCCKPCAKLRNLKWQQKNPEKVAALKAEWNAKRGDYRARNLERELAREAARRKNPEHQAKQREARARWADENRAHVEEYRRARYARERDEAIEAATAWAKANPEKHRLSRMAYKNRKRGARMAPIDKDYAAVLAHDPCSYCGADAGEVDHIDPLYATPDSSWLNLTSACRSCNASKNTKPLLVFLAQRAA